MFPQTPTPCHISQPTAEKRTPVNVSAVRNAIHQPRGAFVSVTRLTFIKTR